MKRMGALAALLLTLLAAAPVAAYEPVVAPGTTNYLELTSTATKGRTTIEYRVDVGVFDSVPVGADGRFYVCLRVTQYRDGDYAGSNSGCRREPEQTSLTMDGSFRAVLAPTAIVLDRGTKGCCLAGKTVVVDAVAEPLAATVEFSGCLESEFGPLGYTSTHAAVSGRLSVNRTTTAASGNASQYVFTPPCDGDAA